MIMVLKLKAAAALAVPLLLLAACAPPRSGVAAPAGAWVEREAWTMGTRLWVGVAAGERAAGVEATERVLAEVRRLEEVLSSWRADSEIGRVNAAPVGEAVAVSGELASLLAEAWGWRERTGGGFDPAVGALIDAWELRGEGRRPGVEELARARAASGPGSLELDADARTVTRRSPGSWLDTGGFGKGVALRAAEGLLREAGIASALLDFGGQVLALGGPPDGGAGWLVEVAHPSRRAEPVARLRVRDASVATSSQSERSVEVGGERYGHVLDPRSGQPVPAWGSVTVVAEDAAVADVLSTALFVLGPRAAREWAEGRGVGVLVLEERGGEVVASWTSEMERYLVNHPR